jgi:hypothetical protein
VSDRDKQVTVAVHDAVSWDDRKSLADVWQQHARLSNLDEDTYSALVAVAQYGARQAAENLIYPEEK